VSDESEYEVSDRSEREASPEEEEEEEAPSSEEYSREREWDRRREEVYSDKGEEGDDDGVMTRQFHVSRSASFLAGGGGAQSCSLWLSASPRVFFPRGRPNREVVH